MSLKRTEWDPDFSETLVKDFEARLNQANGRLKSASMRVRILQRNERLYLRATLPPKPDSDRAKPFQQEIALGAKTTVAGVKFAEAEARKLSALLDCHEFSWEPYVITNPKHKTVGSWVEKFEVDYFNRRSRNPKTETTWKKHYRAVFRRLPMEEELTSQLLQDVVLATRPDSASRKQACIVAGALGKFAGLDFDAKPYRGKYSPKKVKPRELPDDATIAEWFYKIRNPGWRWIYGIMACYGLRPHEAFHVDPESLREEPGILTLRDGKTGGRRVWPCYPEWCEEFGLAEMQLPGVTGQTNADYEERVTQYLRRNAKLPFVLYSLRHCWAIRTLEFGLDLSLAAQQMGHSVQVHTDLYHHWISDRHHQRAFELLMERENRPVSPFVQRY